MHENKKFFFRTRPVLSYFLFLLLLDQNNSIGYTIIDQICVWMERAAQQVHIWLRNMVIFFLFFKVSKGYESLVFLPTICSFLEEIRRGFISCDKEMSSWHPAGCAAAARRRRRPNHNSLWGQNLWKIWLGVWLPKIKFSSMMKNKFSNNYLSVAILT